MKLLVIRMSSMGDIILATSFLESLPSGVQVDWLISKEFAFILKGHPRIQNLIEFDKKTGLRGWFRLMTELSKRNYDGQIDLHVTIRSLLARFFFQGPWKSISKQRLSFYGYLIFKNLWPSELRPHPLWKKFASIAGGTALKAPSMLHRVASAEKALSKYSLKAKNYFVVMPASRWSSKEWGVEPYVKLCEEFSHRYALIPVVLGRLQDQSAVALTEGLNKKNLVHRSVLSEDDFSITAALIQNSVFYVGSDTGLAHLAEAVGTPAHMIFGPTRPDLGFGPWKLESTSTFANLSCSPCSKDGRFCYRVGDRYACLRKITVNQVADQVAESLK